MADNKRPNWKQSITMFNVEFVIIRGKSYICETERVCGLDLDV